MINNYFDYLSDIVGQAAIDKVEAAMLDHIHRPESLNLSEAAKTESTLQYGVRLLVELVRAEADVEADDKAEEKHRSLKAHYRALEESAKQSHRDQAARLAKDVGRFVKGYQYTWDLLLKHRAKRSTFVRLTDLAQTVGMPLDDWHAEREPQPVEQNTQRNTFNPHVTIDKAV